jgi:hypothetical protein
MGEITATFCGGFGVVVSSAEQPLDQLEDIQVDVPVLFRHGRTHLVSSPPGYEPTPAGEVRRG